ncbi:MAG TPA: SDR family oxidoreductase [Pseudonocardiaceae bacterium]|nr:SDR family oxidoreductase [Pseudonocardiaceae bacterium]
MPSRRERDQYGSAGARPSRHQVVPFRPGHPLGHRTGRGQHATPAATAIGGTAANLLSAVLTTNAVADRLASGGAVVHLGSIAADKGAGSYGAAKAAVAAWNVDLARDLGPRGITSNVVSPGYVGDTEFFRDRLTDQRREVLISQTATSRPGTPEDIAGVVHFLASAAARHVTGQVINVNGGAWLTQ